MMLFVTHREERITMLIYFDNRYQTVGFGIQMLESALCKVGDFTLEKPLDAFVGGEKCKTLVVSIEHQGIKRTERMLENGGFEIDVQDNIIYITGGDHCGAMYGLLDLAETIELFGLGAVKTKIENPFLKLRGVKFNLPFEPYDNGDPFEKNIKTCLDPRFWERYIDYLAANRYNCLSLWSEHPFHMMFRLAKYPETCPYSDEELEKYKNLYKFIFRHAKNRGIDVYLITWNIRITPFVARGLGLPEELGDMSDQYCETYDKHNRLPSNNSDFFPIRQHLDIIKDYFKECIKTLAITYRDLKGIGTNCAEEMAGSPMERQNWVTESYLRAVEESGRDFPFIMRTNMGNGKVAKQFLDAYPSKEKYISWKYSNAHMYSHPAPKFEELWGAWKDVDMEDIKVLYTVRNDDIHTLRWGGQEYLKRYITGMKKPYVEGFYWGADGYLWADDFQHIPNGHKTWQYDYERHWLEFELIGRLSYNPELPEYYWVEKSKKHYGSLWGEDFYSGIKAASDIIPAVNRLFWINYDFEWHPESLLSVYGFKTIKDFMNGKPMPGIDIVGIREYVEKDLKKENISGETPRDIIHILKKSFGTVESLAEKLSGEIPGEYRCGEIECTLLDLKAWGALGRYYADKFSAALELVYYEKTGDAARKAGAIAYLGDGLNAWEELSRIWSLHYMPYKMARVKYIFGWPYYLDDVRRDIEIAMNM